MKNIFDSYGNDRCFTVCSMWKYEQGSRQKEDLTIVTTFYPMYDFTKEIVGDEGNVKLLIPAGTEPHDFEPSAKERAEISDADVFVYNSSDMEFLWIR